MLALMVERRTNYLVEYDIPLVGDVDIDAIVSRVPPHFTVKGMFFSRYARDAAASWDSLERDLACPPPKGRYSAFVSYPLADYLRVFARAARLRFPGATREAFRLLARGEVEVFGDSTLGRVTLSLIDQPAQALDQFPRVLGLVSQGFVCRGRELEPRRVEIRFPDYRGVVEIVIGLIEGILSIYDRASSMEVTHQERDLALVVTWDQ